MKRVFWLALGSSSLALSALVACDKPNNQAAPANSASAAASSAPSAVASAPASATPSASASAAPAGTGSKWAGTYKSEKGSLYYPTDAPNGKEWKDLAKWQGDEAQTAGLGEGALTIEVAPDGRVTGEMDAPTGPAIVNGSLADGTMSASIERKNPSDRGFTGTAIAKVNGDKLEGTMRLSSPEANAFRSVTFSLAKK